MISAFAFATPAAIVPTPLEATNFTPTRATGLICLNRKLIGLNLLSNKYHDEVVVILM